MDSPDRSQSPITIQENHNGKLILVSVSISSSKHSVLCFLIIYVFIQKRGPQILTRLREVPKTRLHHRLVLQPTHVPGAQHQTAQIAAAVAVVVVMKRMKIMEP